MCQYTLAIFLRPSENTIIISNDAVRYVYNAKALFEYAQSEGYDAYYVMQDENISSELKKIYPGKIIDPFSFGE